MIPEEVETYHIDGKHPSDLGDRVPGPRHQ